MRARAGHDGYAGAAMRLLVVGFANSIHVARYLQLLDDAGWDVHLFDSRSETVPHPELPAVTLHPATPCEAPDGSGLRIASPQGEVPEPAALRAAQLERTLAQLQPDVVHSHEIQHGGALVDVVRLRGGLDAPWLVTNWGSDIFWFGHGRAYAPRIRSVLAGCDYYGAECHRDVALARAFGFRGRVVGVWPVGGGIDVGQMTSLRSAGPTSARRSLAVKGALGAVGRGDVALDAVEGCADLLAGWELCVYQLREDLEPRALAIAEAAGMSYTRLSFADASQSTHDELLRMHGRARVSLGLNRSDALSTSFLEALAMGSFPVQSSSSCGNEIAAPGRGALFVPADDVEAVAHALRRALTDDDLVDAGAAVNAHAVAEQLDRRRTRARVLDAYERILDDRWIEAA